MTRLPDVINQKINNAGAMEALAKGDEMICVHEWDYSPDSADTLFTCLKCGADLYVVDSINRLNILETNVARLRKEGEEYRAQLASRDALIERLVEAGIEINSCTKVSTFSAEYYTLCKAQREWNEAVADWEILKGGAE